MEEITTPAPRKRGRPKCSTLTPEEKRIRQREASRRYYEKNRKQVIARTVEYYQNNIDAYRRRYDIYRKYRLQAWLDGSHMEVLSTITQNENLTIAQLLQKMTEKCYGVTLNFLDDNGRK